MAESDWIVPGAEVVVISGRNNTPSPVLTIERVLKRDVVLSNGDRWSMSRFSGGCIQGTSNGPWDPTSDLYPADSPYVAQARQRAAERAVIDQCRGAAYSLNDAVRAGRWDDAIENHERLGRWLRRVTEATAPSRAPSEETT